MVVAGSGEGAAGIDGANLPSGVSRSATGISTFEPSTTVPATEEQRKEFLATANDPAIDPSTRKFLTENPSTEGFLPSIENNGSAETTPIIVAPKTTTEAIQQSPAQVAPDATMPIMPEPPVKPPEQTTAKSPADKMDVAPSPGITTGAMTSEKPIRVVVPQAFKDANPNPDLVKDASVGDSPKTTDGRPAFPPGTRTW
jgi:hypothetical protein